MGPSSRSFLISSGIGDDNRSHIYLWRRICYPAIREEHIADAAHRLRMVLVKLLSSLASYGGRSISLAFLEMAKAQKVMFVAAAVCMAHWWDQSVSLAVIWSCREGDTGMPSRPNTKNCRQVGFQRRDQQESLVSEILHFGDGSEGGDWHILLQRFGCCSRQVRRYHLKMGPKWVSPG